MHFVQQHGDLNGCYSALPHCVTCMLGCKGIHVTRLALPFMHCSCGGASMPPFTLYIPDFVLSPVSTPPPPPPPPFHPHRACPAPSPTLTPATIPCIPATDRLSLVRSPEMSCWMRRSTTTLWMTSLRRLRPSMGTFRTLQSHAPLLLTTRWAAATALTPPSNTYTALL